MGIFDRFKKTKRESKNSEVKIDRVNKKEESVIYAGTPQQIKEKYKVDSSDVKVESICRYYTNGKCNAVDGEINICSFKNPQNCENCPVWRYVALGDISAIL